MTLNSPYPAKTWRRRRKGGQVRKKEKEIRVE